MPLAAVPVLERGAAEEAIVVTDDVAAFRLLPLCETAVGVKHLSNGSHLLLQGPAAHVGCVRIDQPIGDAMEDKAGLFVWGQILYLIGLQTGHLPQQRLCQPIVTFWKSIVAPLRETIHVVRPSRSPPDGLGSNQVIALEDCEVLANGHRRQVQRLSQFVNGAAAAALDGGEDEALGALHVPPWMWGRGSRPAFGASVL